MNNMIDSLRSPLSGMIVVGALCFISPNSAIGGDLTIPNSYSSGDTLTAASLNANFQAVETEVDDHAAEIADHETRIGAIESDMSATKYLAIPARGGFVAEGSGDAFAGCFPTTFAWSGTGSSNFYAMVNLPHNSVVTGMTYHYWRSTTATLETTATLYRLPAPATSSREEMATVTSADDGTSAHRSEEDTVITSGTIDNQNFTYYVLVDIPEAGTLCNDGVVISYTTP